MKSTEQSTMEKVNEFDATHSWNGFSYQGKIGLIVVIDKLIELISKSRSAENYSIEFEWLEDFSIKKGEEYLTIHQVKSYGEGSLTSYKDAIWLLLGKSVDSKLENITGAFLHVAENIKHKKTSIQNIDHLIEKFEELKLPKSQEESKSKNNIITAREHYENITKADKKQNALNKLRLYTYRNNSYFCKLEDVESILKEKIEEYYKIVNKHQEITKKGLIPKYVDGAYNCLLKMIDDHVNMRHHDRQSHTGEIKSISFNVFETILNKSYEKLPKEYYLSYFRTRVLNIVQNHVEVKRKTIEKLRSHPSVLNKDSIIEQTENINKLLLEVSEHIHQSFGDDDFLKLLYKISPHKLVYLDGEYENLSLVELLEDKTMNEPWINALSMVLHSELKQGKVLLDRTTFLTNIEKKLSLLTTISVDKVVEDEFDKIERDTLIEEIGINIYKNNSLIKDLFEIDYIITKDIEEFTLGDCLKTNVIKFKDDIEKNNILKIKNVQFRNKDQLKTDLEEKKSE